MKHSRTPLGKVLPLFLVLFIDGMGLGLLFPLLNTLIVSPDATLIAAGTSMETRDLYFGIVTSIFMFCWFFGAALLGDWSDTIGRKRALVICLVGAFLGYLLSALAVVMHSLGLLILGRVIAGFTAGSQPIAQAALVDVSTPESLASNMGGIMLTLSLGFVLGPVIGGLLSNESLVSWFDLATPLYFAAILAFLNAVLLLWFFDETFTIKGKLSFRFHHAISVFISAFQRKHIFHLSLAYLCMQLGWSTYFNFILVYMAQTYHLSHFMGSMFMGVMGLGFSIGLGPVLRILQTRYSLKTMTISGFLLGSIAPLLTLAVPNQTIAWLMCLFVGCTLGYSYSTVVVLFSKQVNENEQGWAMGVTGSICALCFGITALLSGYIARFGIQYPLLFAGVFLLISGALMFFIRVKNDVPRAEALTVAI